MNGAHPVVNCMDELGKEAFVEPMLVWVQYPMTLQVGEHAADYDMFLQLCHGSLHGIII